MTAAPKQCLYCDGTDANCGFCDMGTPLDTQEDWDDSWGRVMARSADTKGATMVEGNTRPDWMTEWWTVVSAKPLSNGRWLCVERMIFHWDLMICDAAWVFDRWTYETAAAALAAWSEWDGTGDAPGPWTRHQGSGRRRLHGDPAAEEVRP